MGYYSQVAFVVRGPKDIIIPKLMTFRMQYKDPLEAKKAIDACTYHLNTTTDEFTIRFHDESVRWCDGYPDVDALNALYETFDTDEDGEGEVEGAFCRVGEDNSDIAEERFGASGDWPVCIVTHIEINCDPGKPLAEVLR